MKYKKDITGRFNLRPHFDTLHIEELCEKILLDFIHNTECTLDWPLSTDSLTKLIERDTYDLDLYTNMSEHGLDDTVDGFTEYSINCKPSIYINQKLSSKHYYEHRLRTTLAHEYGHVLLHGPLFRLDSPCKLLKPPQDWAKPAQMTVEQRAKSSDWMEWQANYAMGALLMPQVAVRQLVEWYKQKYGFGPPFGLRTGHAQDLTRHTSQTFLVSLDAATVRLKHLFLIQES